MTNSQFILKGYDSNLEKGEVLFRFGFRGEKNIDFTEKISFPRITNSKLPTNLLKSLMDNLMLILGISYWKLYAPSEIVIENNFLNKEQAEFWNTIYTKGLGEFFYKNKIDFRGLVRFPFVENAQASTPFVGKDRALLGLGGGKDSIVAAEMLKAQNKDFDLFTVGTSQIQDEAAQVIGKSPIFINRQLDSRLFDLNKEEGVYNGHIPISVIYAFLGLMSGIFYDYSQIIVGNEKSANYGNVEYLGEIINHQWSKSGEFERLFNEYVRKFITPDITYSSSLRNMSELEVVGEFVKYPKYFKVFSSCNRNFKIRNLHLGGVVKRHLRGDPLRRIEASRMGSSEVLRKWCNKCAKCLFVFICLSAFLSKEKVLDIFGKNLFEDKSLLSLFEELIGIRNFKPFECVGTPEEVKEALEKIVEKGELNKTALMKFYVLARFNDLNH